MDFACIPLIVVRRCGVSQCPDYFCVIKQISRYACNVIDIAEGLDTKNFGSPSVNTDRDRSRIEWIIWLCLGCAHRDWQVFRSHQIAAWCPLYVLAIDPKCQRVVNVGESNAMSPP